MDSIEQKLEAIIRRLDLAPNAEKDVPAAIFRLRTLSSLAAIADHPQAQECGSKQAKEEIFEFVRLATALHNHIGKMHRTSLDYLRPTEGTAPELLQSDKRLEQVFSLFQALDISAARTSCHLE